MTQLNDGSHLLALDPDDNSADIPTNGTLVCNIARINADASIRWFIQAEPLGRTREWFNPPTARDGSYYAVTDAGNEYEIDIETGIATPTGRWLR
jgi:hypothetical protein